MICFKITTKATWCAETQKWHTFANFIDIDLNLGEIVVQDCPQLIRWTLNIVQILLKQIILFIFLLYLFVSIGSVSKISNETTKQNLMNLPQVILGWICITSFGSCIKIRWLPQLMNINQQKNGYNTDNVTNIDLQFDFTYKLWPKQLKWWFVSWLKTKMTGNMHKLFL